MITSPLFGWLAGNELLPKRFHTKVEADNSTTAWEVSVALEEMHPLYMASTVRWQSLSKSRELTSTYLRDANTLIDGLWGGRLDREECSLIRDTLGNPPLFCLPIYIITIKDLHSEQVVYIGKTKSSTRFIGGHHVALQLHNPDYSNFSKQIYRCSVLLYLRDEYLALEWLDSDSTAAEVLDLTESTLIYALQPRLNSAKRKPPKAKKPIHIHVQNYADTKVLDNLMLDYASGQGLMIIPSNGSFVGNLGILKTASP